MCEPIKVTTHLLTLISHNIIVSTHGQMLQSEFLNLSHKVNDQCSQNAYITQKHVTLYITQKHVTLYITQACHTLHHPKACHTLLASCILHHSCLKTKQSLVKDN